VLITSHQAFLTNEALWNIAETTLRNISDFNYTLQSFHSVEHSPGSMETGEHHPHPEGRPSQSLERL
jgi:lactate dehydrogenase-like 2-hydroxyacid dehydrogenase